MVVMVVLVVVMRGVRVVSAEEARARREAV